MKIDIHNVELYIDNLNLDVEDDEDCYRCNHYLSGTKEASLRGRFVDLVDSLSDIACQILSLEDEDEAIFHEVLAANPQMEDMYSTVNELLEAISNFRYYEYEL